MDRHMDDHWIPVGKFEALEKSGFSPEEMKQLLENFSPDKICPVVEEGESQERIGWVSGLRLDGGTLYATLQVEGRSPKGGSASILKDVRDPVTGSKVGPVLVNVMIPKSLTNHELERIRLATHLVDELNRLVRGGAESKSRAVREQDGWEATQWLERLIETRIPAPSWLADGSAVQCRADGTAGMLGLLNGLVGARADGWGYIAAEWVEGEGGARGRLEFELTVNRDGTPRFGP